MTEPVVLGEATHTFHVPAWAIVRALNEDRTAWWPLNPNEVESVVLEGDDNLIVWSSPWPASPDDTIEFYVVGDEFRATVRFRWLSSSPPDERGVGITRQRLNEKLGSYLRGWILTHEFARPLGEPLPAHDQPMRERDVPWRGKLRFDQRDE